MSTSQVGLNLAVRGLHVETDRFLRRPVPEPNDAFHNSFPALRAQLRHDLGNSLTAIEQMARVTYTFTPIADRRDTDSWRR